MKGIKKSNEYAAQVENYADIPKAVFAAIAVSALTSGGDYLPDATTLINDEWNSLYNAGIVPQKPRKNAEVHD